MTAKAVPSRIMLKLSGEMFGDHNNPEDNICFQKFDIIAKQILQIVKNTNCELAIIVGGGNIFRGRRADDYVDHVAADFIGMLATAQNGIALRDALKRNGAQDPRLMSTIDLYAIAESYYIEKARHHLDKKRIIILAGGLGHPGFTTDSAVAQRAFELNCKLILKASSVDGVYDSDPKKNKNAKHLPVLSYKTALDKRLEIMDATAFTISNQSGTPIFVFNERDLDHVTKTILRGDYSYGSLVNQAGKLPL